MRKLPFDICFERHMPSRIMRFVTHRQVHQQFGVAFCNLQRALGVPLPKMEPTPHLPGNQNKKPFGKRK